MLSIFLFVVILFLVFRSIGKTRSQIDIVEQANRVALLTLENDISNMLSNMNSRIENLNNSRR